MVIVLLNETVWPAQIEVGVVADIVIVGVTVGVTLNTCLFEVAILEVTQVAFEVITTQTESLLAKPDDEKICELVPTDTPFLNHW